MPCRRIRPESEGWRVDVVLEALHVPEDLRQRPLKALSGGWQRLAMLARVWATEPDVLMLDEPTNHLDLGKIAMLEEWLNALPRDVPVIIASHDRAFLDAVTNRTLFLRPEQSPSLRPALFAGAHRARRSGCKPTRAATSAT